MAGNSPCNTCQAVINGGEKFLVCDFCNNRYHAVCQDLDGKTVQAILKVKEHVLWLCRSCKSADPLTQIKNVPLLVEKVANLSKQVNKLISTSKTGLPEETDIFDELEQQKRKEKNLVISGLEVTDKAMNAELVSFAHEALEIDIKDKIQSISRFQKQGKTALLFVRLNDKDTKDLMLSSAKRLKNVKNPKYKSVYINPELTKFQMERLRLLRKKIKERRENGESVQIRNWKIIPMKGERHID